MTLASLFQKVSTSFSLPSMALRKYECRGFCWKIHLHSCKATAQTQLIIYTMSILFLTNYIKRLYWLWYRSEQWKSWVQFQPHAIFYVFKPFFYLSKLILLVKFFDINPCNHGWDQLDTKIQTKCRQTDGFSSWYSRR